MADDASLVFVAKLEDQASSAARELEATMQSLGGPVEPIDAAVLMEAQGIEETAGEFDAAGAALTAEAEAAGLTAGTGLVDGLDAGTAGVPELGRETGEEFVTPLEEEVDQGTSRLGTALVAGIAAAVTLAVGAAAGLYAIGGTFDDVTDTIRTGTGLQGDALEELEGIAERIGTSIPAEFEDIGGVVADLNTRLGLTGKPLETLATQFLELGRITGEDVDVRTLTGAFSAFGVEAGRESEVLDDLFRVSQATGVGVNELASNIGSGAAALKPFGFSIEESAALLGNLDKAGIDGGSTVAALQRGLVTFAKAGKDPREALQGIVGDIGAFLDKGDEAGAIDVASKVFGTRGAAQFVNAVGSGQVALDDLMGAAGVTGDTILGLGDETADAAEHWQVLKNNFLAQVKPYAEDAFGAIGTALQGALEYLPGFIDGIASVVGWLVQNKGVVLGVVSVMGLLIAATAAHTALLAVQAAGGLMAFIKGLKLVQSVTRVAAAVQWLWNAALTANPIGLIIAAIALLVGALVWFFTQTDVGRKIVAAAWAGIQAAAEAVASWFTDTLVPWLKSAWDAIVGAVKWVVGLVRGYLNMMRKVWETIFRAIRAVVMTYVNIWRTIITTAIRAIIAAVSWLRELPGKVRGWFDGIRKGIADKISTVVSFVKGIPGKIVAGIGNAGRMLLDVGKNVIRGLWNGLSSMAGWIKDKVIGLVGRILPGPIKDILGIASPSKLATYFGRMFGRGLGGGIASEAGFVAAQSEALATTAADALGAVGDVWDNVTSTAGAYRVSGNSRATTTVRIEHVVTSPDGSVKPMTARELARLLAGDPQAAAVTEQAVRRAASARGARTLVASNGVPS